MATIESQDLALEKLFNDFYVVPDYQREYIWQEKQVYQLLKDIHDEFSSNGSGSASEYFIGSIVVHVRDKGVYELIDGQQRMTTAYLVLCAVRDYRQDIKPDEPIEALKNLSTNGFLKIRTSVAMIKNPLLSLRSFAKLPKLMLISSKVRMQRVK